MSRHQRCLTDPADSDASFSPDDDDELFELDNFEGVSDSDATTVEDLDVDDDLDAEIDVEDQMQLFGGNVHPPEYYQRAVEEFNESAFDCEDYSSGTNLLLDTVEEQWRSYEAHDLFVCYFHWLITPLIGTAMSSSANPNNVLGPSRSACSTTSSTGS